MASRPIPQDLEKKPGLGPEIIVQVPVIIQVVLGQVGKNPGREAGHIHPMLHQGMGGDFQDGVAHSHPAHLPEEALEVQGLGGGHRRRPDPFRHPVVHRAHHPHLVPGGPQDGLQEKAGGGFAVGAGDAHQDHFMAGVAIEGGAQVGQGQPGLGNPDRGHPGREAQNSLR
jgi:hypothetical protein